jgi:hypothetical protein
MAETTVAKTSTMSSDGKPADEVKPLFKAKKITKADWSKVEKFLKEDLENRKLSDFRKTHESIWKEVDRQVAMQPMLKVNRDGAEIDMGWHNVIELGELSKASENIAADVVRITFPQSRFWFEAHSDIVESMDWDDDGNKKVDPKLQTGVDGRLRSMMVHQQKDFGLESSCELSIKEALHHGSYVVEVDWEEQDFIQDGDKVSTKGAPKWIPHSMWNCYPDPSPSVIGTSMFYTGSMFIESYMPRYKSEQWIKCGEDGWMPSQWKKVSKDEHVLKSGGQERKTKDVKITTYWGDVAIERDNETLFYPNHKVRLFNGTIVYMAPNKIPFKNIIFDGYERMDVRDPYYMSPIIKMSPMQKLASTLTNKFMDGVELHIEPPIVYDGNDPDFVINGGPVIAPGVKVSTKGTASFKEIQIGDLKTPLEALQLCLSEMKEKLGRPGKDVGDRATKAEVVKNSQDQEVSLVRFIGRFESSLRSYLYMQHAFNLRELKDISFYSPEMSDPDFIRIKNEDLPRSVHFEVVGSRGVLGEEERSQKMSAVTAFASGNPLFAPLLNAPSLLTKMYQDAGVKNAETLLVNPGDLDPLTLAAKLKQTMQLTQQLAAQLKDEKSKNQYKMTKIQADQQFKMQKLQADQQAKQAAAQAAHLKDMESARQFNEQLKQDMKKERDEFVAKMAKIEADMQKSGLNFHNSQLDRLTQQQLNETIDQKLASHKSEIIEAVKSSKTTRIKKDKASGSYEVTQE